MKVLIGVCGGIAAYKVASVVSVLVSEGHEVKVVMTENATKFITPLTFSALSQNQVYLDDFTNDGHIHHIELANWADVYAMIPLTYNTTMKLKNGVADNLLTSIYAAIPEKVTLLFFPAMNSNMYKNLTNMVGLIIGSKSWVQPEVGKMACGTIGPGKLPSVKTIIEKIKESYDEQSKR